MKLWLALPLLGLVIASFFVEKQNSTEHLIDIENVPYTWLDETGPKPYLFRPDLTCEEKLKTAADQLKCDTRKAKQQAETALKAEMFRTPFPHNVYGYVKILKDIGSSSEADKSLKSKALSDCEKTNPSDLVMAVECYEKVFLARLELDKANTPE